MKIKLYESKWDNKIKGELAIDFYDAIKEANIERVKECSKNILNKCKEFFPNDEDEYVLNDIDVMIDEFDRVEEAEMLDELLANLYDFCDNYLILINVSEEPEDAEVYVDSSKDIGTKEKSVEPKESSDETEIEPIEVTEVKPEEEK